MVGEVAARVMERLLRIDLELEASLDEAGQARHDPVASRFAADVDVAVVRISHEAVATMLQCAIQFIQHEIRARIDRAASFTPARPPPPRRSAGVRC
jgi:hypothetical protein